MKQPLSTGGLDVELATVITLAATPVPAAEEAGACHREEMGRQFEEIRSVLAKQGVPARTAPDKAVFVRAAQKAQDDFAADKGEGFKDLIARLRAAAE
ncbi:MAG: hypothetical protein MI785_22955 [Kiloniellales bacterium]|nr:hypothetical protein [Kiloniellales bacterium]